MRALDQNQMSNRSIITDSGSSFLIPDLVWFENIKSQGWRDDVRRSFEVFHDFPNRLHIAFPVGTLLRHELVTRSRISDPVDYDGTSRLRNLLAKDNYVDAIENNVGVLRRSGLEPVVHLADSRSEIEFAMEELERIVGRTYIHDLRGQRSAKSAATMVSFAPKITDIAEHNLLHTLSEFGIQGSDYKELSLRSSALFRTLFCFWCQVFQYTMGSPHLQKGDKKLVNDLVDSDYAIVASYCESLETSDIHLRQRYDAVMVAIRS